MLVLHIAEIKEYTVIYFLLRTQNCNVWRFDKPFSRKCQKQSIKI